MGGTAMLGRTNTYFRSIRGSNTGSADSAKVELGPPLQRTWQAHWPSPTVYLARPYGVLGFFLGQNWGEDVAVPHEWRHEWHATSLHIPDLEMPDGCFNSLRNRFQTPPQRTPQTAQPIALCPFCATGFQSPFSRGGGDPRSLLFEDGYVGTGETGPSREMRRTKFPRLYARANSCSRT